MMEARNLYSKSLKIENKKFYFDYMENERGRFLRITEKSGGRSSIIIPESGLEKFKDILIEIAESTF